jgi:periplasmic divalent cation tolerance protein
LPCPAAAHTQAMAAAHLLYITCPDAADAERIARIVVGEGLAACANILPRMRSIYRWQGEVAAADECVLILKTISHDRCTARVASVHVYQVPCILAIPVAGGHEPFLAYLEQTPATEPG